MVAIYFLLIPLGGRVGRGYRRGNNTNHTDRNALDARSQRSTLWGSFEDTSRKMLDSAKSPDTVDDPTLSNVFRAVS